MKILGIAGAFTHDPSAALLVDGKIVAAVEEERLNRKKHAIDDLPVNAVNFCLKQAGLRPEDIDVVAYPWSPKIYQELKWKVFQRKFLKRTSRAWKTIVNEQEAKDNALKKLYGTLEQTGIDANKVQIKFVEHHMAHIASAYYLSGFKDAALMSIDGGGELSSCLFAEGKDGKITKIYEIIKPDSLGRFYSTVTAYLGFSVLDGEYKVMGMAPFGDPKKIDMSHIIWKTKDAFRVDDDYVWPIRSQRHTPDLLIPKKMVKDWGPPRQGDSLEEPYMHIAAATQETFDEIVIYLMERHLTNVLLRTGNLCFAGGCALNVTVNRKLINHPLVKNLWVQPAAHDSGTSLGAAAYAAHELNEKIEPMTHVYLGPEFSNEEIKSVLDKYNAKYEEVSNIVEVVSSLLAQGQIVAWFQGRMEFGPRSLGARSILGNPKVKGTADKINEIIKFREKWRPFCPSILPEYAREILNSTHSSPYMTFAFKISPEWAKKIPEVVHVDGTGRPQIVDPKTNKKYYDLISAFHNKTGVPVLINTSLNRRGEPMVCSPMDAMEMFYGSGLQVMAIGDYLVKKQDFLDRL